MNNLTYIPFMRNRYFDGKLLTAEDFEQEQRYLNDKRRLLNRWLFGTGVAAGLDVIVVDDYNISVEMGLALDGAGREIVVDAPVIRKLSSIDGYEEATREEGSRSLYLCIEYREEETEPVHNINCDASHGLSDTENGKYREGYHLFVTEDEPPVDSEGLGPEGDQVIDKGRLTEGYRMNGGELGEEKGPTDREGLGSEEYKMTGKGLSSEEYKMTGNGLSPEEYKMNGKGLSPEENSVTASISKRAEAILGNAYLRGVYLAKILLVKAGPFYMIDKLYKEPCRRYVMNQPLEAMMIRRLRARVEKQQERIGKLELALDKMSGEGNKPSGYGEQWQFAEGKAVLPLRQGAKAGECFFSEEIAHGLGLGNVQILLRVLDENVAFSGDAGIFDGQRTAVTAGTRLKRDEGTFIIGLRLLRPTELNEVEVGWTAIRNRASNEFGEGEKRLYIMPGMLNLKVREDYHFSCVCVNMEDQEVSWEVETPEGGTVDKDGNYHAPSRPGVYVVTAKSVPDPAVRASVFIIVRDD